MNIKEIEQKLLESTRNAVKNHDGNILTNKVAYAYNSSYSLVHNYIKENKFLDLLENTEVKPERELFFAILKVHCKDEKEMVDLTTGLLKAIKEFLQDTEDFKENEN